MKTCLMLLAAAVLTVTSSSLAIGQSLETLKDNKVLIHDVQEKLKIAGYSIGKLDGAYGSKTGKVFETFAKDKGLGDASLADKLQALGIDLSALDGLTFTIEGNDLKLDNGLDNNFSDMVAQYDWKSFDVGRYRVTDGVEIFALEAGYCDRFGEGGDCDTGRSRVQFRDPGRTYTRHEAFSFEFRIDSIPAGTTGAFQIAELFQHGGFKAKHPETGDTVSFTPKFTLEATDAELLILDNSVVDVNLFGGQIITDATTPIAVGEWTKVAMDVVWGPDESGLFRYWVNDKPMWSRTGRNTNCEADGSTKGCELAFKYGPYDRWEDPKVGHIDLSIRNMRRETGDAADALIATLGQDFAVTTERKGGATPDVAILTSEQISDTAGQDPHVNVLLKSILRDAPAGENEVKFNIQGEYSSEVDRLFEMRFVVLAPIGKAEVKAIEACGDQHDPGTDSFDGETYPVINFKLDYNAFRSIMKDCVRAALATNPKAAFMYDFLLTRFRDMASDMAAPKNKRRPKAPLFVKASRDFGNWSGRRDSNPRP